MKGILRLLALAALLASAHEAQAQAEWFDGIWQDSRNQNAYFSLHIDGNQVVLVDLATLERTGRTLASAYRGELGTTAAGAPMATVRVLAVDPDSQGSAQIFVNEDKTLRISWCHLQNGGCLAGFTSTITKVF